MDELEYVIALMGGCSVPFCDILEFAARIYRILETRNHVQLGKNPGQKIGCVQLSL